MKACCFAIAVVLLLAGGCVTRLGDFTVGSTKNMDIKKTLHRTDETVRNVGVDVKQIIVLFPTGAPNVKEAMDEAIEKSPGAVGLSNVTVKYGWWFIPYIYGRFWYEVEGSPVYEVGNPGG